MKYHIYLVNEFSAFEKTKKKKSGNPDNKRKSEEKEREKQRKKGYQNKQAKCFS